MAIAQGCWKGGAGQVPPRIVVIGLGNPLRGDDGIGPWLVERALPRWIPAGLDRSGLALRSCRQLLPEQALELDGVRHLLVVDAWMAGDAGWGGDRRAGGEGTRRRQRRRRVAPWLGPLDGRLVEEGRPSWRAGHGLQPQELLALAAALGLKPPRTDGLLVPGCSWQIPPAAGRHPQLWRFSPPLRRQLPQLRWLLRAWLRRCAGHASGLESAGLPPQAGDPFSSFGSLRA